MQLSSINNKLMLRCHAATQLTSEVAEMPIYLGGGLAW